MYQVVINIIKGVSIPALLIASILPRYAASYQLPVDLAICMGAVILVQRAVWFRQYFWAAGFVSISIVFSPLSLATKVFALMGVTCVVMFLTMMAAFRRQPLPVY